MPRCICARQEAASDAVAQRLGLAAGAPVFHTLIVHFEDGVPLQCEDRYVNPASAPDYLGNDFTQTTPTQYLLQVAPFWQAQYSIEAALPTAPRGQAAGHRPRRALPGGACAAPSARRCRSPPRGWCTRARATCCRENSSHEPRPSKQRLRTQLTPQLIAGLPPRRRGVRAPAAVARRGGAAARRHRRQPGRAQPARQGGQPAAATRASSSRTSATGRTTKPTAA